MLRQHWHTGTVKHPSRRARFKQTCMARHASQNRSSFCRSSSSNKNDTENKIKCVNRRECEDVGGVCRVQQQALIMPPGWQEGEQYNMKQTKVEVHESEINVRHHGHRHVSLPSEEPSLLSALDIHRAWSTLLYA